MILVPILPAAPATTTFIIFSPLYLDLSQKSLYYFIDYCFFSSKQ